MLMHTAHTLCNLDHSCSDWADPVHVLDKSGLQQPQPELTVLMTLDRQPQAGLTHERHGPEVVILECRPLWPLLRCSLRLRFPVQLLCKVLALLLCYL